MERRNFFRTLGLALAGSALIPHEQRETLAVEHWRGDNSMLTGWTLPLGQCSVCGRDEEGHGWQERGPGNINSHPFVGFTRRSP